MSDSPVDPVVLNVKSMAALRDHTSTRADDPLRCPIERLFRVLSLPAALYVLITLILLWIGVNVLLGERAWDPAPFLYLQGLVAALALLSTVSVLIVQARQSRFEQTRAELDLQINLMAEQKVAKLIALIEELRRDLPNVRNRVDQEAAAMQQETDPASVLEVLQAREHESGRDATRR